MDHFYSSNVSATPPAKPTTGAKGFPKSGASPTTMGAYAIYSIVEELVNAIKAGGGIPDETKQNQLAQVILDLKTAIENNSTAVTNAVKNIFPYGSMFLWPGEVPPYGSIKANGIVLPISGAGSFPELTKVVQNGLVRLVGVSEWSAFPGCFVLDNTTSTIRIPDGRNIVMKGHHDGSTVRTTDSTDAANSLGRYQQDALPDHKHVFYGDTGSGGGPVGVNNGGYGLTGAARSAAWMSVNGAGQDVIGGPETKAGGSPILVRPENKIRTISALWCIRAYA